MIFETVVSTLSPEGEVHLAPMGVRYEGEGEEAVVALMPFKPSRTLDNILATRCAVLNLTTDVRVFAGCVTGRREWPTVALEGFAGRRLEGALAHVELELRGDQDDALRPTLRMRRGREVLHASFPGFNRAQAAVIEGAVLVSRLGMLPRSKVETEMEYLQIAIDKTAGPREQTAWDWLYAAVERYYAENPEAV
ncbi:hypothetical protein C662_00155 [Thauera sp. 28]|uniref:DUF447 domain-containing protein n=1 Tax=unclassified Thauera TaxID=2609274 RepID=UPI0002CF4FEE|nr:MULTISPECIES: DUF447 domain-containing protein [unclassified Thauera]ENO94594.1 hypothetical protein C662_00155 [Thauera sp. 28]WBL65519.1 DUF447 family protein [Thauera sp. WB-2]